MDTRENAQAIVDLFNDFYRTDPDAAALLIRHQVSCNDAVADHPGFIVSGDPGKRRIGIVGLLNGLFSESHRIGILVHDDIIMKFKVVDVTPKEEMES